MNNTLHTITNRQAEYRAYLNTPLWKGIRLKALECHGSKCCRCGGHGSDVHHKTYKRVGGNERMEDLEVMCRPCHEAHHRVENVNPKKKVKKRKRSLHIRGMVGYMTLSQKKKIKDEFLIDACIVLYEVSERGDKARNSGMKMLGLTEVYGIPFLGEKCRSTMIQRINQGAIDPYRKKKKKGKSKRRKIKEAMSEEGKGQLSRNNKFRAKNNNRGPDDGKTWSSRALPIT